MASKDDNSRLPMRGRLLWVPLSSLRVNPVAQRELDDAFVDKCVNNFNPDAVGVILVNKRGTTYHVVDGQHRVEMFRRLGWGDQSMQCEVFEGLDDEQEAKLFRGRNFKRSITAMADWRVALTARDEDVSEVDRVVRAQRLVVTHDNVPGAISAPGTLLKCWRRSDSATLGRGLRIIRDAFGDAGLEARVIDGLTMLCQRYNGELDEDLAVKKLSTVNGGVNGLLGKANVLHKQGLGTKPQCTAAAAVEIINAGRGGKKLPDWWKS